MINSVIIGGTIPFAPRTGATQAGKPKTTFRINIPKSGDRGGFEAFDCVAFGEFAGRAAAICTQDAEVIVTGRLSSYSYKDDSDEWQTRVNVLVNGVRAVVPAPQGQQQQQPPQGQAPPTQTGLNVPQGQAQGYRHEYAPPPNPFGDMDEENDPFRDT